MLLDFDAQVSARSCLELFVILEVTATPSVLSRSGLLHRAQTLVNWSFASLVGNWTEALQNWLLPSDDSA